MRLFDYNTLNARQWDNEMLNYLSQISEYKGRQALYLDRSVKTLDRLVEVAKIQSTVSSNEIEGIATTNRRAKQLLTEKTTPHNRNEEEILGYRRVLEVIHENYEYIPLTPNYILQLHRDLYQYVPSSHGGRFKNIQNYVTETLLDGTTRTIFEPLPPYEVEPALNQLCATLDVALKKEEVNPLLLIFTFIHDFLCIHPFNDGNGRLSRLLTTLLLYRSGYVVGRYISLEKKIEETKSAYYRSLQKSGIGWHEEEEDATPFVKYMLGILIAAYRDFEDRVDIFGEKTSAIDRVTATVGQKLGKFTKSEILESTPELSASSVEAALKRLADEGLIVKHGKGPSTFYTRNEQ